MLGKVVVCADGEAACRPEGQLNRLWQNPGRSGWEFEVAGLKPNDDDRKWAEIVPFVLNSFSSHPKVKDSFRFLICHFLPCIFWNISFRYFHLERLLVLQIYGLNLVFLVLMQALIQLGWPFLCRPGSMRARCNRKWSSLNSVAPPSACFLSGPPSSLAEIIRTEITRVSCLLSPSLDCDTSDLLAGTAASTGRKNSYQGFSVLTSGLEQSVINLGSNLRKVGRLSFEICSQTKKNGDVHWAEAWGKAMLVCSCLLISSPTKDDRLTTRGPEFMQDVH